MTENKEKVLAWKACNNETEREKLEKENGTRWSELHRISYFDCIRCSLVIPMHNLFMGTANRMAHLLIEHKLIRPTHLRTIQQLASGIIAPPEYDNIQRNIGTGFSFMKSDQWRSWCLVYSPFVLKPILPKEHFENWILFVDACQMIVKPSVSIHDLDKADELFRQFGKGCEVLYGRSAITPNMHFSTHMKEVLRDFGTVYSIWLYSFERYNKLIKNLDTNNKGHFELTFIKSFLKLNKKCLHSLIPSPLINYNRNTKSFSNLLPYSIQIQEINS